MTSHKIVFIYCINSILQDTYIHTYTHKIANSITDKFEMNSLQVIKNITFDVLRSGLGGPSVPHISEVLQDTEFF